MSGDSRSIPQPQWRRARRGALLAGVIVLGACAAAALLEPGLRVQFFASYLIGYLFWLGLALGSLVIWLLHNLTGGRWGLAIHRLLEAATRTLPVLALLFVPIALGVYQLYVWAHPEQADEPLRHLLDLKEPYLNVPFFMVRAAGYFAIWLGIAALLIHWTAAYERTADPALAQRVQTFSGPALVLYGATLTFAAIDWVMSLDPAWWSTIFGAIIATGQVLPAFALAVAGTAWLGSRTQAENGIEPDVWNDLGSLLLAFVMLWTYLSFSQLLIIWSGNLKEEITWYYIRSEGGWQWLGAALALFYFAVPFLMLLSRAVKRQPRRLAMVAALIAFMSALHQFWLVAPMFSPRQFTLHWLDLAAFLGVGGIWLAMFAWQLQGRPQTPPGHMLSEASHA